MKNITVSDEMYEFLMDLSKELNTQNNRETARPYFYQIQTQELTYVPKHVGLVGWRCPIGESFLFDDYDVMYAICEYKEWDTDNESHIINYHNLTQSEIEEILDEIGYEEVSYEYKDKFTNAFLTEKACKKHIESNKYNYNKPVDYLSHAHRNPELEMVIDFLRGLSN